MTMFLFQLIQKFVKFQDQYCGFEIKCFEYDPKILKTRLRVLHRPKILLSSLKPFNKT